MSTKSIRDFMGMLGNIGLIAGLILVAYQIKQTNDLAKAQMISEGHSLTMSYDLAYLGETAPEVIAKLDLPPSDLSDQELLLMERLFRAKMIEQIRNLQLLRLGLSDSSEELMAADLAYELNSAFGRMYWEFTKDFIPFKSSFVAEVDRNLLTETSTGESKSEYFRRELEKRLQ